MKTQWSKNSLVLKPIFERKIQELVYYNNNNENYHRQILNEIYSKICIFQIYVNSKNNLCP